LRSLGDERTRELVHRYIDAWEAADIDGLVELLTNDVAWTMPPLSTWYQGLDAVIPFLVEYPLSDRWRHLPTRANGQLAVGCYLWDAEQRHYGAALIDVLTLRGNAIAEVTGFTTPRLFARFGLPEQLAD
jgi:RNA polymerase sigma-70 factor (ECF subfamily)